MRRLLAMGLGCLVSFTASSEDLLTIFDQAVVNDPTVREAEFTRQATREAKPQAWAAYLPQINGNYNKGESEGTQLTTGANIVPDPVNPPSRILQPFADNSSSSPEFSSWGLELRQTIFNWGGLVQLKQSSLCIQHAILDPVLIIPTFFVFVE